mgnify:CR=1 FL=1
MEGKWVMLWEFLWTDNRTEDVGGKKFNSFAEVKNAAREKIREIEVSDVVASIRNGINKDYRNAIGDFFERYFADPNFPRSEKDIPSTNINNTELCIWITSDEFGIQDEITNLKIQTNLIFPEETKENYFEYYSLEPEDLGDLSKFLKDTTFIFDDDAPQYMFQFERERWGEPFLHGKARVNSAYIKFCKILQPELLDVVSALKNSGRPMSLQGIASTTMANIRTLSHWIEALKDLGVIRDAGDGLYELVDAVGGSFNITPTKKPGSSVYPILILDVLERSATPMNMQDIAYAIRQKYGIAIKRQTVSSHLAHLRELGYQIQKDANGYTIQTQNK